MYLKKLEIQGFKSFANKTALEFLPDHDDAPRQKSGITAIVGPNGSGKSNVADAIRWAIGEQSLKNLRGKKSEDVIFAGTDKKTKLGSASVTLYFDNSDKRIPIEFAEVSITRKIYRSGESEYQINGSRVRLLDIVDLLAKAGIGKDSYCVITQGMSDSVLNATPVERRAIFEDAAGVKQYQIEKERSLRKLASTDENLARVGSLLVEIEPHLRILKRQAEKASQGKDTALRLKEKQLLLYGYLWKSFETERGTVLSERDRIQKQVFDLEVETNTLAQEVSQASAAMENQKPETDLNSVFDGLREQLNRLTRERSLLEGKVELELERQKKEEVVRVIPVDLVYVQKALEDIRNDQQKLIERIQNAEKLEDLQDIREFAQVVNQRLADLSDKAGQGSVREKKVIELPDEEKKQSDERIGGYRMELAKNAEALKKVEEDILAIEGKIIGAREAEKAGREEFFAKEKSWREKELILTRLKDQLNEAKVRLARVEVREEDLVKLVADELNMPVAELTYDGTPVEREKLEREIARLKVEVEHIGSIDPLVVSEYEETRDRFDFLTRESADLREAMESLQAVIVEMDQKIESAFKKAFAQIKENFAEYFKLIFGGGKAELQTVNIGKRRKAGEEGEESEEEESSDIPLLGIEIFACPPGKKITNLSMLSGGERSLTSLALLFAIISYNPPPFAVLDEVEAALDEANSRRFGKMLGELSAHTQFVAITHNRETMSQAGLLYGVTMGADGVSQLLSIRLDQVGENGKVKLS